MLRSIYYILSTFRNSTRTQHGTARHSTAQHTETRQKHDRFTNLRYCFLASKNTKHAEMAMPHNGKATSLIVS